MAKLTEQMLAKYYDGELSEKESRQVEALLNDDPQMQTQLAQLNKVSELIKLADEQASEDVSFDGFKEGILNQVRAEKKPSISERVSVWAREFFEHRKMVWAPLATVSAAAVALVLAMPVFMSGPNGTEIQGAPTGDRLWTASHETVSSASVLNVKFESGEYKVFELAGDHGGTSPVVWLEEKP